MKKVSFLLVLILLLGITAAWGNPVFQRINFTKTTTLTPDTYIFRFSLWSVATEGDPLTAKVWEEEKTITLTSGTISTYLGSVTPLAAVDFSQQYWVQVERETKPDTWVAEGARTRFNVVPYAMWSAQGGDVTLVTAGSGLIGTTSAAGEVTLNVGAGAGIKVGADAVGIKTGGVSAEMLAANAITNGKIANGAVTDAKITGPITGSKISSTGLNADSLDGKHAADFMDLASDQTIGGTKTFSNDVTLSGNLNLPLTTAATGIIKSGSVPLIHSYGSGNFFAGHNAGNLTMKGDSNTAIGIYALSSNTNGTYNTASGGFALRFNTSGSENTASGHAALTSNTTGYMNTASGDGALYYNTKGFLNTASGYAALNFNSTGFQNTAYGVYALNFNTTGYANTASGVDALYSNTNGYFNTASGNAALYHNTTGDRNTAGGDWALHSNTTGNNNTAIGTHADVATGNLKNATAIGSYAVVNASNKVRIGDTSVTVIEGQVGWSYPSDIRIKRDVQDIGYGLDFINSLRPVQYRLKEGNGRIDFGFIAQDVEALLGTEYNVLGIGEDADRKLSLRYTDFIAPMVKAMQEQQAIIEMQQAEIDILKSELKAIKAMLLDRQ